MHLPSWFTLTGSMSNIQKIIHLSDLHVGNRFALDRFSYIVDAIFRYTACNTSEFLVVVTGDVVDKGGKSLYSQARMELDRLLSSGIDVFTIPGNHDYIASSRDIPLVGLIPFIQDFPWAPLSPKRIQQFNQIFVPEAITSQGIEYPIVREYTGFVIIGLDSLFGEYQNNSYEMFWNADGNIGSVQLRRLENILIDIRTRSDKPIVLCLHHHPVHAEPRYVTLEDRDELQALLKRHPVDIVLFGHKHVYQSLPMHDTILCYNAGSSTDTEYNHNQWLQRTKIRVINPTNPAEEGHISLDS